MKLKQYIATETKIWLELLSRISRVETKELEESKQSSSPSPTVKQGQELLHLS